MNWTFFNCLIFTLIASHSAGKLESRRVNTIREAIQDLKNYLNNLRRLSRHHDSIFGVPQNPEDLPEAESVLPGHTLIRPTRGMLKSQAQYPLKDTNTLVYGNLDNLGASFAGGPIRVLYSDFRKRNRWVDQLIQALRETNIEKGNKYPNRDLTRNGRETERRLWGLYQPKTKIHKFMDRTGKTKKKSKSSLSQSFHEAIRKELLKRVQERLDKNSVNEFQQPQNIVKHIIQAVNGRARNENDKNPLVVIEAYPAALKHLNFKPLTLPSSDNSASLENNAEEILDNSPENPDSNELVERLNLRRNHDVLKNCDSKESSSDEDDPDHEKNPGNPYTVHKNKYRWNFLWNDIMSGDHMNINPHGPSWKNQGPSAAELFFGRKWWYFNQDDFKPLR